MAGTSFPVGNGRGVHRCCTRVQQILRGGRHLARLTKTTDGGENGRCGGGEGVEEKPRKSFPPQSLYLLFPGSKTAEIGPMLACRSTKQTTSAVASRACAGDLPRTTLGNNRALDSRPWRVTDCATCFCRNKAEVFCGAGAETVTSGYRLACAESRTCPVPLALSRCPPSGTSSSRDQR